MTEKTKRGWKQVVFFIGFIFLWGWMGLGSDNQAWDIDKLKTELTAIFQSKGESGVRDFVKGRIDSIGGRFIIEFTESVVKGKKKESLDLCLILAEEKNDEKTKADVWYKIGEYYRVTSDNKKALEYFDAALRIYEKLEDTVGRGNCYRGKGDIYFIKGDNIRALEMYDNALPFFEKAGDLGGLANLYRGKGQVYFYTGDFESANKMYDEALSIFVKSGNIYGQGSMYLLKGLFFYYKGDIKKALESYEKALPLFEKIGEPSGLGNVYRGQGDIYLREGKNSLAMEKYQKALSFFEKANDGLGQANVYRLMGNIYFYSGEQDQALEIYDKALELYKKGEEILGQGNILTRKGEIYLNRGENSMAMEMFDKGLVLFEAAKDPMGQGSVYYFKGDIYFFTGSNSKAIEMYDKAMSFFKEIDEPMGQGNVLNRKGDIYFYTGNNSKALEMYNLAVPFFKMADDLFGQGNILQGTGDIYFRIGDHAKALEIYDKALNIFTEAEVPSSQASIYLRKGFVFHYIGDDTLAFTMLDKALAISEKEKSTGGQGDVYRTKGDIYLRAGKYSDALRMYNSAFTFFEKENYVVGMGELYRKKGDTYFYMEDYPKALEMYEKGESLLKKAGAIESVAYALHGKASVLEKLGKTNETLNLYKESILKLEKVRAQTAIPGMKQTFMESIYDQYEKTVVFMLTNKYYDLGFTYIERMKARVFLDRLAEGLVPLEKGISPELKQKNDDIVSKLSRLNKQMDEATNQKDEKRLTELKRQQLNLQTDFDQLLFKIRLGNPLYSGVQYPEPITLQELQNVLKEDELMLRYFVSPDKLYAFIISKKEFNVIPIGINEASINQLVENYLDSIGIKDYAEIKKYSTRLANEVFKPLKGYLKKRENIIIVPDGELIKVPFESYIIDRDDSRNPVYLVSEYRVKYVQSATVLALIRKHYKREGTTNHFIGFGDPVYDYANFKKEQPEVGTQSTEKGSITGEIHHKKYDKEGGIFVRLIGSGEEVETIADFFKRRSQQAKIYKRVEANETNAKSSDLINFDYIHFSCHGVMGDGFQGLVLSQVPGSPEDGYLTLNEIMNCDYNARLVVLSACQTGKGEMTKGEGVTGLTQAVMYAGTPAVVASLWGVDEDATKDLLVAFYKYMVEGGMTGDEALRKAKLALINSEKYASPYYWAAFVMYGE